MTGLIRPRVFSIPFGVPFLPRLTDALLAGELVEGFRHTGDPLALASVTIFVPTRRAARELRSVFVDRLGGATAILPLIKPLGDVDEDAALFEPSGSGLPEIAPPIEDVERLLLLAPLVRRWKERLPAHVMAMFDEPLVVPVTAADAIWLARDVAALMDEVELEGADWNVLPELAGRDLAGWWQVTLDFLQIVTKYFPEVLAEISRSNPAAYRNARIDAEAERLAAGGSDGPVIAAGSTGSIPATARLLSKIAKLPRGAVVLPGLDRHLDDRAWQMIADAGDDPALFGHPQFGLRKLVRLIGVERDEVTDLRPAGGDGSSVQLEARGRVVSEALRPAESTELWAVNRNTVRNDLKKGALGNVSLVEAPNERDEAMAIAIALRRALHQGDRHAALVTGDRALARRVSAELGRFGITADDSAGTPLDRTSQGTLLTALASTIFRPGDPVSVLSLLKHPLLRCGLAPDEIAAAVTAIEFVALRAHAGRPDASTLDRLFEERLTGILQAARKPQWFTRLTGTRIEAARKLTRRLADCLAPLAVSRTGPAQTLSVFARLTVAAYEAAGAGPGGDLAPLYEGDAGEAMAKFLRKITCSGDGPEIDPAEWPEALGALVAGEIVKPSPGGDPRISIWGVLEARLQNVDTIVLGGLNEGSWPVRARADRFMSRLMKAGLGLEPPERRIGLAAHDFAMALGAPKVVLTRAGRSGEEPAVPSRWLQRLLTVAGKNEAEAMLARGGELLGYKAALDTVDDVAFAARPRPCPPLAARPKSFSVTEIETLRRDPYAVHAKRILRLHPLDPLLADPGPAERGTLFHDIMHHVTASALDPAAPDASDRLDEIARAAFARAALPPDIEAIWWPRYISMVSDLLDFERRRRDAAIARNAEISAAPTIIGVTEVTLRGRADRIDLRADGTADIIDFKTGSSPSVKQARTLLAPQLALEGALLARGAFADIGAVEPSDLVYVRLKSSGEVAEQSVLKNNGKVVVSATELSALAWDKLSELVAFYADVKNGYLSRSLPFRQRDTDGDYDHLARVLEWSAGGDDGGGGEE